MVREELRTASEILRAAAEDCADAELEERIYNQSLEFAELATADRGPDQGRLDRHRNVLRELAEAADPPVADRIETAADHLRSYREGVSGV
ncbi:MAG: hypothetical protein ABEJ35_01000 [Halobacteriaceae archaeon]